MNGAKCGSSLGFTYLSSCLTVQYTHTRASYKYLWILHVPKSPTMSSVHLSLLFIPPPPWRCCVSDDIIFSIIWVNLLLCGCGFFGFVLFFGRSWCRRPFLFCFCCYPIGILYLFLFFYVRVAYIPVIRWPCSIHRMRRSPTKNCLSFLFVFFRVCVGMLFGFLVTRY